MYVKKIKELIGLAWRINLETEFCAFVEISGHVNAVSFSIRKSKKEFDDILWERSGFYYDSDAVDDNNSKPTDDMVALEIFMEKLINSDYLKEYTAVINLGITSVRKTFYSKEQRYLWVEEQKSKININGANITLSESIRSK